MKALRVSRVWTRVGPGFLPFADAATKELPLGRLLRLSLFQVTVGMATVLLIGTLNRVMIVEMGMSAWLVSLMVALPLVSAPFRALIGFRSDTHRSVLGWRRVPYIWMGTLLQFGGLAIMPFAATPVPRWLSCLSAPGCRRCRPPVSRSPPTWRRRAPGRASSRSCTRCCWSE
jgi:MFS transporter, BCD family, chlorophyll transporter